MDIVSYKFQIVVTSVRERKWTEESIQCGLEQSETLYLKKTLTITVKMPKFDEFEL